MNWSIVGTIFLCIVAPRAHAEEFVLPPNDGFITDPDDIIPLAEEEELEELMFMEKRQTGLEFVSVLLPTLGGRDIAHLAWELRTKWGLQQHGSGVLLLVALKEGKVLIAPGEEHMLTDAVLQDITETEMLPSLRQRQYTMALERGMHAVRQHLWQGSTEEPLQSGLSAKGARYPVAIFLLVLLGCCTWARVRRRCTGSARRRLR